MFLSRAAGDPLHECFAVVHDVLEKGLDEELPVHQLTPFGTRGRPLRGKLDEGDLQSERDPETVACPAILSESAMRLP